MMRKHVDVIAIALLLAAAVICSHTRVVSVAHLRSSRAAWLAARYHRFATERPAPPVPFSRD